jgi:hypothetical protein
LERKLHYKKDIFNAIKSKIPMIQRIQTLYLLLAAAATGGVFFLPFFSGSISGTHVLADGVYNTQDHIALMSVTTIVLLDTVLTIFLFKNRKQQSLLTLFVALSNIALIAVMLGVLGNETSLSVALPQLSIGIGSILPLVSVVFALLARRGIVADDKLVRSADRLR